MAVRNLGKLKKTTKERCPDCGSSLQIRSLGIVNMGNSKIFEKEYFFCPRCGYELDIVPQKRRMREKDVE